MRRSLDIFLSRYNNPDLYFLHADMWSFPRFKNKYPHRCLNIGVQESNMINIAGGLASQGKTVIVEFPRNKVFNGNRFLLSYKF